jgi:hypothetical protein
MTTYQAQLDALKAQEASFTTKHQAIVAAIKAVIADQICAEIGEQFRAHVIALPHSETLHLLWRGLAGHSAELSDTAEAFGAAMVDAGYLIKRNMYHNYYDNGGDAELRQDDIDSCCCPIRGEVVSKARFDENCYPLWESTGLWATLLKAAHEEELTDEPIVVGENLQAVIDYHAKALDEVSAYAYLELSYTRRTAWMIFVTSHQRTEHPDRKILISGQGHTPESACADALSGEPKPFNPDQIVESIIEKTLAENANLKKALTGMVNHESAANAREGLEPSVELQFAKEVLGLFQGGQS